MFIGHFAPAFVAAAASKKAPSLGTLFIAAQLLDWGFFTLALLGIENLRITPGITRMNGLDLYYMPYTHSLIGSLIWAVAFGGILAILTKSRLAAVTGAMVVFSHFLLDLLVHRADLTISGGEPKFGLGLWNHPMIEIPLEFGILIAAFLYYTRRTRGPEALPYILLFALIVAQSINILLPNLTDSPTMLCLSGLASFAVFTALAFWVGGARWHKKKLGLAVPSSAR